MAIYAEKIGHDRSEEQARRQAEVDAQRQTAINSFGPELGEAYFNYAHGYGEEKKSALPKQ